jgi:hypothetical protein
VLDREKVADHALDLDQGGLMDDIFGGGAKEPAAQHDHDHPNSEVESQAGLGREAGHEKGELGCEARTQSHHPRVRQEGGLPCMQPRLVPDGPAPEQDGQCHEDQRR